MCGVRSAVTLAVSPDFRASAVTCRDSHSAWSAPEVARTHRLVLVRRGRFRRRARDGAFDAVPGTAYLSVPGEPVEFAHPAGGDVCTSVCVTPALWHSVVGDGPLRRTAFHLDNRVDLLHRRLTGPDTSYAAAEHLVRALAAAARQALARPLPGPANRRVVAAAREAVVAGVPESAGLVPLARALGVSPYRLSRAFSAEMGVSLTRFRNQVRVTRALDRLEAGEEDLAGLAAELGFADQAHLTRTVRSHVGHPPGSLRRLLAHR